MGIGAGASGIFGSAGLDASVFFGGELVFAPHLVESVGIGGTFTSGFGTLTKGRTGGGELDLDLPFVFFADSLDVLAAPDTVTQDLSIRILPVSARIFLKAGTADVRGFSVGFDPGIGAGTVHGGISGVLRLFGDAPSE